MQIEWRIVVWAFAAILLALLLAALAPVLLPFVIGLTLAYFLNPLVDLLGRIGLPRWFSAILLIAATACLAIGAFVFVIPVLASQADSLITALPEESTRVKAMLEAFARERLGSRYPQAEVAMSRAVDQVTAALPGIAASVASSLWSQGTAAFNFLSLMLVMPLVLFYGLVDWPKLVAKVDSWLPLRSAPQIRSLAREIDSRVAAFIRGQGTLCIVLAIFYAAALSALGLKYGLLVGLLTGMFSFIPFAGWALGLITATVLAAIQFWPEVTQIALVVGVFVAGQALDAAVLSPKIVGAKIGLHPVWLIFALLAFSYLFGFLGLLVAVPVAAAIGVLVRFVLQSYLTSSMYRGQNIAQG